MVDDLLATPQLRTLMAAVNRIIPADDYPNGWDAGVGGYFAQLLIRERHFLPVYQSGLEALEAESQTANGIAFADLAPERQDALLARVEAGEVSAQWPQDPAAFFQLLVEQTLEGFYADPGNGGNKNGIAWDMVGYRITV